MDNTSKNNFIINISGYQQSFIETDKDNVEMTTTGDYDYEDGLYYIDYDETEISGMEGTHTSIEIGSDYVSLQRGGSMNTDMLFMEGRKTHSMYHTPFGELLVGIYTSKLDIQPFDKCCTLYIEYDIEINDKPNGRNSIEINVLEAKQK